MDKSADRDAGDPGRALRRRRFLTAGGELALALGAGGLLAGCNFSRQGSGTGPSTTTGPGASPASSTGGKNPLSGASSNSSS